MVISIYTVAESWFFQYIREPVVGRFNKYERRRVVISIYTVAGGWSYQYIREPEVSPFNI